MTVFPVSAIRASGIPSLRRLSTATLGRGAAEVAQVIGDDPVVLFGHGAVVATETPLNVAEEHVAGVGGDGARGHRIGVTLHDYRLGRILREVIVESLDAFSDLMASGGATDLEEQVGSREFHFPKERFGETGVVMLAGVNHPGGVTKQSDDVAEFDDLGPGAEDDAD